MSQRLPAAAPTPAQEDTRDDGTREQCSIGNLTLQSVASDDYYDDFSIDSASEASRSGPSSVGDGENSGLPKSVTISRRGKQSERSKRIHKFCKFVPKFELHAHLSGCVRESTLRDLAKERGVTLSPKLHAPITDTDKVKRREHAGETKDERDRCYREGNGSRTRPGTTSTMYNTRPRSLLECFEIFTEISKCVNDLDALKRITREALDDFAEENVCYLELRSTPKCLRSGKEKHEHLSKKEYVQAILDIMDEFEKEERIRYVREKTKGTRCFNRLPLVPRFLMSVDRSGTIHDAMENVSLAIELFKSGNPFIVGVELGGNPTKNYFRELEPAFKLARDAGLRVSIHCGEVPCGSHSDEQDVTLKTAYDEAIAILKFGPDRLGHALLLTESIMELLRDNPIPIECCPTSNVMTLELALHHGGSLVEGCRRHPQLLRWLSTGYPISINTDDSGVFHTNSTRELLLLAKAWHVDENALGSIILGSLEHIFEPSEEIRNDLRQSVSRRVGNITRLLDEH